MRLRHGMSLGFSCRFHSLLCDRDAVGAGGMVIAATGHGSEAFAGASSSVKVLQKGRQFGRRHAAQVHAGEDGIEGFPLRYRRVVPHRHLHHDAGEAEDDEGANCHFEGGLAGNPIPILAAAPHAAQLVWAPGVDRLIVFSLLTFDWSQTGIFQRRAEFANSTTSELFSSAWGRSCEQPGRTLWMNRLFGDRSVPTCAPFSPSATLLSVPAALHR